MDRWISVHERMPQSGYGVILCAGGRVQYGWLRAWAGKGAAKWRGVHWVIREEVTHWQPLPPPPEDNSAEPPTEERANG
jgi:hypothetical protein